MIPKQNRRTEWQCNSPDATVQLFGQRPFEVGEIPPLVAAVRSSTRNNDAARTDETWTAPFVLPQLHHNPHLREHRATQTYVYHFLGGTKRHLPKIWWKRGKYPAQPIDSGKHAQVIFDLLRPADGPMRKGVEVGVFHGSTAANLLALMPDLQLYGVDPWAPYQSDAEQSRPDHVQQISDTQTLHWGLPITLRTLGEWWSDCASRRFPPAHRPRPLPCRAVQSRQAVSPAGHDWPADHRRSERF